MAALTDVQREILQMYALGDGAPQIARDLNLTRANVINELSRLCGLNRDRASDVLAERVDLADLIDDTVAASVGTVKAAIAASNEPPKQEAAPEPAPAFFGYVEKPQPVSLEEFDTAPAIQPWDNEPPITPTYTDYRAYRCSDCGRTGPGSCQPGHTSEPVTIRIFDSEVHP